MPGAGGTIGLAQFVRGRRGDGNALMVMGLVMVGAILTNASRVTLDQTKPIAPELTGEYEVLTVPADSPMRSVKDLVTALRASPRAVSWGGGSAVGTHHILAALIADAVGIDPHQVNYVAFSGGGEAAAAALSGQVTVGVAATDTPNPRPTSTRTASARSPSRRATGCRSADPHPSRTADQRRARELAGRGGASRHGRSRSPGNRDRDRAHGAHHTVEDDSRDARLARPVPAL